MKRHFLFVVAVMVLTACGGAPAASEPPASTAAAPATEANATMPAAPAAQQSGGATQITYMMWGSPEELEVWNKIVEDFHSVNPNITVKVDVSDWDSYWNKLKTLYASTLR